MTTRVAEMKNHQQTMSQDSEVFYMEKIPAYILNLIRNQGGSGGITPSGEIEITENGTYDVTNYAVASVQTPVPTGTISITQNGTVDVTNYASANVNVASDIEITNVEYLFYGNRRLSDFDSLKTCFKNITSTQYMFNGCNNLVTAPLFNMNGVLFAGNMFTGCSNLETIPQYDFSTVKSVYRMLYSCSSLKNVPILNFGSLTSFDSLFESCSQLTNESLNNILASLLTATSYGGQQKLSSVGLSSTQATTCTGLSNWQACVDAGWTTGY